jgi:hypothetical protein
MTDTAFADCPCRKDEEKIASILIDVKNFSPGNLPRCPAVAFLTIIAGQIGSIKFLPPASG